MASTCVSSRGSLNLTLMSSTVGEAVERYVATRRWAAGTTKHSTYTLGQFAEVVGGDRSIRYVDHEDCARWWATRQHLAASSARSRRSTVANFLSWCRHTGLLEHDPLAGIPIPREPRRMPATLTDDDVTALLKVVPDYRAEAIVSLMLRIGLRCVDVSNLQVAGVDLRGMTITVHGKGGHVDLLPLPQECATAIERYLSRHRTPAGPLFRTYTSPPRAMSAQCISEMVGGWLRDAGLKRDRFDGIGAHALRRTCATELLQRGNIRQVQAVLRHASLSSTERYLRRSEAEELRQLVDP
jgi:site-specific recombinase XerD